jgi:hypothetical protein
VRLWLSIGAVPHAGPDGGRRRPRWATTTAPIASLATSISWYGVAFAHKFQKAGSPFPDLAQVRSGGDRAAK